MPKVPGKIKSSLQQRNSALHRRGVKTSQEYEERMFRAARNKTTTRISNCKFNQSPSSNTSHSTEEQREQDSCSTFLPPLHIHLSLHHLPSSTLQQSSLAPHPATLAWTLGKGCHGSLDAVVGPSVSHHQRQLGRAELGCLFPLGVSTNSCLSLPLPAKFSNNKNICRNLIAFEIPTSCQIWWELAKTLKCYGRGGMRMDKQTDRHHHHTHLTSLQSRLQTLRLWSRNTHENIS